MLTRLQQRLYRWIVPDSAWCNLSSLIPLSPHILERYEWGRHQPILVRRKRQSA